MGLNQSYNSNLITDLDRVRFLSGDTDVPDAVLEDEEILWLISEEPNVYFAAARAIGRIALKVGSTDDARLAGQQFRWNGTPETIRKEIQDLREKGAKLLTPKPSAFRVL